MTQKHKSKFKRSQGIGETEWRHHLLDSTNIVLSNLIPSLVAIISWRCVNEASCKAVASDSGSRLADSNGDHFNEQQFHSSIHRQFKKLCISQAELQIFTERAKQIVF